MTASPTPRWSEDEFREDATTAIEAFRDVRIHEPLEQYLEVFDEYRSIIEDLIEETVDLSKLTDLAIDLLTDPHMLTVVRYLSSPAVSEDDLKVLANAVLSPSRLRRDTEMVDRIIDTVLLGLDRNRFPWVSEDREATTIERQTAITSTAALIATQKVQTARRTVAKDDQENSVADFLLANGFTEVPRRTIPNVAHLPAPGEFCRESLFGSRKADLVVRLWDGRTMPTECKVSNSATNSVKRLNNDAAVKAKTWLNEFGTTNTVPVAVLSGVFKIHNLANAQSDGLTIFWAHRLDSMLEFLAGTRP